MYFEIIKILVILIIINYCEILFIFIFILNFYLQNIVQNHGRNKHSPVDSFRFRYNVGKTFMWSNCTKLFKLDYCGIRVKLRCYNPLIKTCWVKDFKFWRSRWRGKLNYLFCFCLKMMLLLRSSVELIVYDYRMVKLVFNCINLIGYSWSSSSKDFGIILITTWDDYNTNHNHQCIYEIILYRFNILFCWYSKANKSCYRIIVVGLLLNKIISVSIWL